MSKPRIIGYAEVYDTPPGSTLIGSASAPVLIGRRPMYAERPFHAKRKYGGYLVYCKRCETNTLTSGYLPHDSALRHKCLYNPKEANSAGT